MKNNFFNNFYFHLKSFKTTKKNKIKDEASVFK